jgi:hypothetical protein
MTIPEKIPSGTTFTVDSGLNYGRRRLLREYRFSNGVWKSRHANLSVLADGTPLPGPVHKHPASEQVTITLLWLRTLQKEEMNNGNA